MEDEGTARSGSGKLMKYGMWACCAVMILPILAYVAAGGASGATESLIVFVPLVLCVGVHLVMHRFMGKSCHGKARDADDKHGATEARADTRIAAE